MTKTEIIEGLKSLIEEAEAHIMPDDPEDSIVREDYDQILILSTVGENKPHDPGIDGLKTFWVENGKVKEL